MPVVKTQEAFHPITTLCLQSITKLYLKRERGGFALIGPAHQSSKPIVAARVHGLDYSGCLASPAKTSLHAETKSRFLGRRKKRERSYMSAYYFSQTLAASPRRRAAD